MKRLYAHYTLVRLLPQADAGEFANIGVVLACPETGFFGFRLIRKYARVTQFFEEITRDLFTKLRKELATELNHIQAIADVGGGRGTELLRIMQDLAKPRETILRYASLRLMMTDDPAAALDKLFARYIQREFAAAPQYHEQVLTQLVRRTLKTARLADAFAPDEIGTDDYHVKLPFVHERDGKAIAAIKPLDLTQDEPTKIYDHGGQWLERVRRLRRLDKLPAGMLFAAEGPDAADDRRHRAYDDIVNDLREMNIQVVDRGNARQIINFAKTYVQ
ncbi:MAG: DUF3037 domain-containing protein [Polaromonas sp.]